VLALLRSYLFKSSFENFLSQAQREAGITFS